MLAEERQREILARLEARGSVRTVDLAEELSVTDETVRRDLQALAKTDKLRRIHGGAMRLNDRPVVLPFMERKVINVDEKRAIALLARELVQAGDTIAVDSSTTVAELVALLPGITLRVVTNAQNVLIALADQPNIELIALGGRFHPPTQSFHGLDGLRAIERFNINKLFVSCNGLDLDIGASEAYEMQAAFKQAAMDRCEQVHLLVDHSKFGQRADYFFADLNHITSVVTDARAGGEFVDRLHGSGIDVRSA
jgi:DeoR/GlpR family transcriptional regulator of sugar metabolism